jgi:hypothetical protein
VGFGKETYPDIEIPLAAKIRKNVRRRMVANAAANPAALAIICG